MTSTQTKLAKTFPSLPFQFDFLLAPKTYFKVGGLAEVYVELDNVSDIVQLVSFCTSEKIALTALGGASNVIVADEGVSGVVLHPSLKNFAVEDQGEMAEVTVGAGLKTALLVKQTTDQDLTGLEYFLGVPGTVGGAVYNNAHYLTDLMSEHIAAVQVINQAGKLEWLSKEECEFGYDSSRFQKTREIILQVKFRLKHGSKVESLELIKKATVYRASTQPLGMPSSGCIFQNVPNTPELQKQFPQFAEKPFVPGGFLIDQAGLKGEQVGDVQVSHKHAAFFVNLGKGTALDIKTLINRVKSQVKEKFGVELHEEVFWLQ